MRSSACALVLLTACGLTSQKPPQVAPTETSSESPETAGGKAEGPEPSAAEPSEPAPGTIPTACAANDPCVPDAAFVKRLCSAAYPDVALVLMAKDSPFTHMYMRGDVDGWNADGGASTRARLVFDEEVLVLRRRAAASNAIVVGSGAAFLVMRWDGNCYTLEENELTARRPPAVKNGPIPWRFYSDRTKDALLKSPKVLSAVQRRGKECKGATRGDVPLACEQADVALSSAVVAEIRGGTSIPTPDRRP